MSCNETRRTRKDGASMRIESNQLGRLDIGEQQVLRFPQGLLGFEDLERFALVSPPEDHPFRWLVSIEDPDVHFAVAPPACFLDGPYLITLTEGDAESIELAQEDRLSVYIIASAGHDGRVTGNLKGPVVVNVRNGFARQLLVYSARYLLHQHLVAPAGGQTGRTAQTTVRLAGRRVA